jgi:hypothetical protein
MCRCTELPGSSWFPPCPAAAKRQACGGPKTCSVAARIRGAGACRVSATSRSRANAAASDLGGHRPGRSHGVARRPCWPRACVPRPAPCLGSSPGNRGLSTADGKSAAKATCHVSYSGRRAGQEHGAEAGRPGARLRICGASFSSSRTMLGARRTRSSAGTTQWLAQTPRFSTICGLIGRPWEVLRRRAVHDGRMAELTPWLAMFDTCRLRASLICKRRLVLPASAPRRSRCSE